MYTTTDAAPAGLALTDFPAPAGRVIAGAFDDALETNPVPLFLLARELNANRDSPRLLPWDAMDQAKKAGVSVKVPDDGITQAALSILIERRKDDAARDTLFARREGPVAAIGTFGAGLAGTMMDPANAASGFIPVLSGTRYAGALAKAATLGSRTALRAGIGAAEGLVGAAVVELPTIALRRDLQDEYGLYDSLANVAFGTFASSGLRMVGGAARDRWRGLQAARQEDYLRSVEPSEWAAVRAAHERQVERDMNTELELGFERGQGASDGLQERWAQQRVAAEKLAQVDETIGRMHARMSDAEIEKFVEAEKKLRAEAAAPDESKLLDSAGIAERKFREMDLKEVKERLAKGEGLVIVPGSARETLAAISDETHAQALKTAVGQAVEGRRIDVDPVVYQDAAFGPQRMSRAEVLKRAEANMATEAKVGGDAAASRRADGAKAPAADLGGAEPPPPLGSTGKAAGAEAKPASLVEAEERLAETRIAVEKAANDAGLPPPPTEAALIKQSDTYDKAWQAISACVQGRGL